MKIGDIVSTNYGTGPYKIIMIDGPSTEPSYSDEINRKRPRKSEPHYNLTVQDVDARGNVVRKAYSYLNGYRMDGTNVWDSDRLIFHSTNKLNEQFELFAA